MPPFRTAKATAAERLERAYDEITCDLSAEDAQYVRDSMRDFFDSEDDREGCDEEE